jgi:hypothetical protein
LTVKKYISKYFFLLAFGAPAFAGTSAHQDEAQNLQQKFRINKINAEAYLVLSSWADLVNSQKKVNSNKYLVDARDAFPLFKKIPDPIYWMVGIKTRCSSFLKPKASANTIQLTKDDAKRKLTPAEDAFFAKFQSFFDDPKASCKDPKSGFELFAVTAITPEKLTVLSINEKRQITTVSSQ